MRKALLLSLALVFMLVGWAVAQERTVSGTVTDAADGTPLPGVNVVIKGTTTGSVTDANGKYQVKASGDAVLVFSFVGYVTQEVKTGAQSTVDVALSLDSRALEEVVVTGYGVTTKSDIAGSISSVKAANIENLPVTSFQTALQGRTAGVRVTQNGAPGAGININIRGQGSLGSNQPLYIIDGVQVSSGGTTTQGSSNALAGLNSNDIESIEVLKDAAASAIYGAQSANGVVIITTKRGKQGKSAVNFTVQKGVVQPLKLYDVMNAQEFATIKEEAYRNAGLNVNTAYALYGNPNDASTITPQDWVGEIFRKNAKLSTYDLSLSGADEKTSFYVSAAYHEQEGQVVQSNWRRGTLRMNLDHKVNKKLTTKLAMMGSVQDQFGTIANGNFVNSPLTASFVLQPNSPARNENGAFNPYPLASPGSHFFGYNILQGVAQEKRVGITYQNISSVSATYQFIPEFSVTGFAGIDYLGVRDINNRPSTIPAFAGFGGSVFEGSRNRTNFNTNVVANFNKKFGEDHKVYGLAGFEYKQENEERIDATGRGFVSPYLTSLDQAAVPFDVNGFYTGYKRAGVFGRVNYDFKSKYSLNVTLRRDGNSRFGVNNQWGTFYAVGAVWNMKEESFLQDVSFIEDLKLRGSYGLLGNSDGIGNFTSRAQFGGRPQYVGLAGQGFSVIANDLLSWEKEKQINIGLDFGLFKNRIFGSVDFWKSTTTSQLLTVPLPFDSGFGSVTGNDGSVLNQGFDLELGSVNVDKGGFKWTTSFNISYQYNELTGLVGDQTRIGNTYIVGQPIKFLYLVPFAGVNPANGRAMYYNINDEITYAPTANDLRVTGQLLPKFLGGLANTFTYKGITLDFLFQYEMGHSVFLGDMYNLASSGSYGDNQLVTQLDRWQKPGDMTSVPKPYEGGIIEGVNQQAPNGNGTTRYQSDVSYIRLKQINLNYELPKNVISKLGLQRVNVFAQAMNLLTFTKFPGIDPEVISNNNDQNLSTYGSFPNGRQITGGITIGF